MIDLDWLVSEFGKNHTQDMAFWALEDHSRIPPLVDLFTGPDPDLSRRAAWVLDEIWLHEPTLVYPFLTRIAEAIPDFGHTGSARHAFKILAGSPLPEESAGFIIDLAFQKIADPQMPVAVKVYAIYLLAKVCKTEQDLKNELRLLIHEQLQLPNVTPALRSCAKKVLKGL
ncbi:MAG: hypothetical protein H6581_17080 [Bacteroidia bacterium]|nr:hypothetical protein [Bacteroidia bacterium]